MVPLNTESIPARSASDSDAGGPENGTGAAQSLAESACSTLAATKCPLPSTRTRSFKRAASNAQLHKKARREKACQKKPAKKSLPLVALYPHSQALAKRMAGPLWLERFWFAMAGYGTNPTLSTYHETFDNPV